MSEGKRPRSIWKRYEKAKGEAKKEDSEKLHYRIGRKSGRVETNLLEWERSWKDVKILKYPTRYADELRTGVRNPANEEEVLKSLTCSPMQSSLR